MNKVYGWLLAVGVLFGAMSCDEQNLANIDDLMSPEDSVEVTGDGLEITDVKFSDDHKVMELSARLLHNVGPYDLTDSSEIRVEAKQEVQLYSGKSLSESQPEVVGIKNISREEIRKINLKLLVLVDLSLPQEQIDQERIAVREMRTMVGQNILTLAFMHGDNVSETYEATDYVINNYFQHRDPSYTYLYRSILSKLTEMEDSTTAVGKSRYKILAILSGGTTYIDDTPVDPMHFELQQQLADKSSRLDTHMSIYYAHFAPDTTSTAADPEAILLPVAAKQGSSDATLLQFLCQNTGGLYQTQFEWPAIEDDILSDYDINYADYLITLEQPDKKVFRGNRHNLQVSFRDVNNGDLIVQGSTFFYLGGAFTPVIVRGNTMLEVLIQGLLTTLVVLLLTWLVLQLLEPYIRYQLFKRKYVREYGGSQMSINGEMVSESCYLCKAPFEEGDLIVTKCKHTMHKHCWDENEYHCPEHGRHCQEGSHYYNSRNLWDGRNALFYMKWALVAIVAGFLSWVVFTVVNNTYSAIYIERLVLMVYDLKEGSKEAELAYSEYGSHISYLPKFCELIAFFVTLCLSFFTVLRRKWVVRIVEMLLRAVVASVLSFLCSLAWCAASIAFHLDSSSIMLDWIPWALTAWIIMVSVTFHTRARIRQFYLLASGLIGFISMLAWSALYGNSLVDYRVSLLLCFVTYAVAIAVCIAHVTPKSERYFLHVEGAVKEMDIALYKWFRETPGQVVSIGRSVDCSIQLSWDMNGKVAPLQAEIRRHISSIRLVAVEDGVYVDADRPLPIGEEVWLYHGRRFTIGNTTFTYIEKDN